MSTSEFFFHKKDITKPTFHVEQTFNRELIFTFHVEHANGIKYMAGG